MKANHLMRWGINTGPLTVLHANPWMVKKQVSNLVASP